MESWQGAALGLVVVGLIAFIPNIEDPFISHCISSREGTCIANLKQIDSAKEQWAMDRHKDAGALPKASNLAPEYIKVMPTCPSGGKYVINPIGTDPTCSLSGHALP
jgi:general secretion pathway protein G